MTATQKTLQFKAKPQPNSTRCTTGCTCSPECSRLTAIVATWDTLPDAVKSTIGMILDANTPTPKRKAA